MSNLRGETVIYDTVVAVVDIDTARPVIQFQRIERDDVMDCGANRESAIAALQRISQSVGLVGTGEWDSERFELQAFEVSGFSEYEETPLVEALQAISKKYGHYY